MKRMFFWLAFVVLIAAVLGACTRSATGSLPPTPTAGAFPTNVPTGVGNAGATQTAVAMMPPQTGGGEGPTSASLYASTPNAPKPTQQAQPMAQPTSPPQPTPKPRPTPRPVVTSVPAKYVLHKGEFPYCIARRFNINPDALLNVNGLSRGQYVYPGTALTIPQGAGPFPYQRALRPHPTTYTVQAGDTFYSIACLFGDVWPEAIAAANGMSVNATLTPGQTLRIP